ncbi:uncharacterized protein LOC143026918 [Oratosquilla oratoria]|uniref:uncharacterized protein LOC143026918 n=1 Tax=Oratosquilla oratoria TaxID=337810 RepID=UPI003F75D8D3
MESDGSVSTKPVEKWQLPLAAIFCIAIAVYVFLIIIGLWIRKCLKQQGFCQNECQGSLCCNCAEIGLRCALLCDCCGPIPTFHQCVDSCCPEKDTCSCMEVPDCPSCTGCGDDFYSCQDCRGCCQSATPMCSPGPLCACGSCACSCSAPQCSTINCLCCEITIKGRGVPTE